MADLLLECVIQIKGLADTPRRLRLRIEEWRASTVDRGEDAQPIVDLVAGLAEMEARWQQALTSLLTTGQTVLPTESSAPATGAREVSLARALEAFTERRQATVATLEACSASDLSRTASEPSRREMTVSDLVALMFARDTEELGRLRPPATRT